MQGLNNVQLIGNLGADPELRITAAGTPVLRLRLATTETWKGQNGQQQEHTEWHTVTVWGKRGEGLAKILSKGRQLFVAGPLRSSSYEDREGVKRTKTEIIARNVVLCGSGRGGSASGSRPAAGGDDETADPSPGEYGPMPTDGDDIPF